MPTQTVREVLMDAIIKLIKDYDRATGEHAKDIRFFDFVKNRQIQITITDVPKVGKNMVTEIFTKPNEGIRQEEV